MKVHNKLKESQAPYGKYIGAKWKIFTSSGIFF